MQRSRSALVVAATPSLATHLCAWLKLGGWQVVTVHSYPEAKARLEPHIDLVVTELELGDYNGLQLALRAQTYEVPVLVIGRQDEMFERDAEQLGSTYLCKEELDRERFLVAVDSKIEAMRYLTPAYRAGPGVCSTSVVIHAEPLWLPPNVAPLVRLTSRSRLRRFDPASTLCSGARQSTAKNLHVTPNLEVCRAVDFPHLSLEFTSPKGDTEWQNVCGMTPLRGPVYDRISARSRCRSDARNRRNRDVTPCQSACKRYTRHLIQCGPSGSLRVHPRLADF